MINKPQVLGKDLNVYSVSYNDNSPGSESNLLAISNQVASRNRDIKAIKPITLRSWIISNFTNSTSGATIETNSCVTNIESSENFKLKFLRNSQTAFVKNKQAYGNIVTNTRYIIYVSIYNSSGTLLNTVPINPKCSVTISLNNNNELKFYTNSKCLYPIGSIYYSFDKNNPSNIFTGTTWELQPANCFIYSANGFTQTIAGESTHVLQPKEIPNHVHSFSHTHNWYQFAENGNPDTWDRGSGNTARRFMYRSQTQRSEPNCRYTTFFGFATSTYNMNLNYSGSSSAHNNTPQYIKAYCWRRTG